MGADAGRGEMDVTGRPDDRLSPGVRTFVGRSAEIQSLAEAADHAAHGRPQLVVVVGPAGIGKSAVVTSALDHAPHFRRIVIRADESESLIDYSVLGQLTVALPSGQAASLPLLSTGPPRASAPVSVGAELVRVLGDLDLGGPLALVLEDAHWLDVATSQALQFAARRLSVERALLVVTTRGGARPVDLAWSRLAETPGLGQTVQLAPLSVVEVADFVMALRGRRLPPIAARRLHDQTAGHPLHTRLVLEDAPWEQLVSTTAPLAVPPTLGDTVLARLSQLSAPAQDLVVAVAAIDAATSLTTAAAVSGVAAAPAALEEAAAAGLLEERTGPEGRRLAFPHPLLARAVIEGVGPTRRRAAHQAALKVVLGDAALRHRVAAADGPDDALAADLEQSAARLEAAGETSLAAERLLAAADASPGTEASEQRFLVGMGLLLTTGDLIRAAALAPRVRGCRPGPRRSTILAGLAAFAGRFQEAEQLLISAYEEGRALGDARIQAGVRLLAAAMKSLASNGGVQEADDVLAIPSAPPEWRRQARAMGALGLGLAGRPAQGLARLDDLPPAAPLLDPDQVLLIATRGALRLLTGDEDEALVDLRAVEVAIRHGRPLNFFAPFALAFLAEAELGCGSWDDAAAHAGLAVSVAEAENRVVAMCATHGVAGRIHAERGNWADAQSCVDISRQWSEVIPSPANRFYAAMAAACLARARGDPQAMVSALDILVSIECPFRRAEWQVWRAEALLGTGRADAADRLAATVLAERGPGALPARLVRSEVALARSDLPAARHMLTALIDEVPTRQAFLRARVDLARGTLLSTGGVDGGGQAALQRAYTTFSGLGAGPWAQRCQQMLTRHGRASAWRREASPLSERERQVAHLVAAGLSNAETAARLYVSRKAIEFHLTHVYQKLGISSRRALASELAATRMGPVAPGI
jgi:DNA-binding CsgD family transcriptional regulator